MLLAAAATILGSADMLGIPETLLLVANFLGLGPSGILQNSTVFMGCFEKGVVEPGNSE